MEARVPVTFAPADVTVWVEAGTTVLDAARRAGILIAAPCGGRGVCGKCAVRVVDGELQPPDDIERSGLTRAPGGVRLACRARVDTPVTLRPVVGGREQVASHGERAIDEACYAGVDVGTTTVGAVIVGASSGRELGRAIVPNSQQSFGADVVSRISAASAGNAQALQHAAVGSIIEALELACGRAGACLERVTRVAVAANTVMLALLERVDVSSLGQAPFEIPADLTTVPQIPGLDSRIAAGAEVIAVPWLGGFVGGDVSAGLLAAGLLSDDADSLFIDIGTNAELVARSRKRIFYASAAAGPAFEGYGIASGGPAVDGAIIDVRSDKSDLKLRVLGEGAGEWLSGSGLISAVSTLLGTGHLDPEGLLRESGPLAYRFSRDEQGVLRIALGPDGAAPYLTQLDVRALQSAKAAVAAGIVTIAAQARLKAKKITRVVVSGTFGSSLHVDDLVSLGIVPEDVADRVESLPEGALTGAAAIAFDPSSISDLGEQRAQASKVELATSPEFTGAYIGATRLAPYRLKKGF